jgi:hypothetical protein
MTSKERFETAWSFREPDRVPIELQIDPIARQHPRAERLVQLVHEHTDNFFGTGAYSWGFCCLPAEYSERDLERRPGEWVRRELCYDTPVGPFTATIRQPEFDPPVTDYHWEKRYFTCPADLERLLEGPFEVREVNRDPFDRMVEQAGDRGITLVGIFHPLGWLVRHAAMEEVYTWFKTHPDLMHRFLQVTNEHVAGAVEAMCQAGVGPYFAVTAHEMLIPPWAGTDFLEEFVFPYDKRVNDVIHRYGGKLRAHCHGNCMAYLERFSEMGIDAIEPLEGPPMGDCDLAEAKHRVGDRMMLSGNVPSPYFNTWTAEQVEEAVCQAIRAAAPGGGFSLRTTGGSGGTGTARNQQQLLKMIENCEVYMDAALKYGSYPI